MEDHVFEIKDVYHKHDDHYCIETADLIVLCFELLFLNKKDIDDVFSHCFPLFDKKLNMLLEKKSRNLEYGEH